MSTTLAASASFAPADFRAASLRQVLKHRFSRRIQLLWASLETMAQRRADAHLTVVASLYEAQLPDLAAELRRMGKGSH